MDEDAVTLARIAERAQSPGEGLRAVARLRERLGEIEARQVDSALDRGWSWTQVGRSLGISKQAAHRRHATRERGPLPELTPRPPQAALPGQEPRVVITGTARTVVAQARQEAVRLGAGEVEPAHLLLALLQAPAGAAREALEALGIRLERTRAELATTSASRGGAAPGGISDATRRVLEDSLSESQRLCHGHLGPEHLLLALLRGGDGPAAALLDRLGAKPADVEGAVCAALMHADFTRSS